MFTPEISILTQKLVEIPTITGEQEACTKALDLIDRYLGPQVFSRTFVHEGVVSRLWGDPDSLMNPRLLLSGHIDVVDAEATQFVPFHQGNRIYGRGAGDMKGHIATMVASYKKWVSDGGSRGIGLLLTGDEEIGGFNGTRHVIGRGLRPKVVFIPDGELSFDIVKSQKAPHHFHIRASGPGGHASRAFQLDNPINRLLKLYARMREKYSIATADNSWHSTFELTVTNTPGNSANAIPATADIWFSWRWPLEEFSFEEGVRDMQLYCQELNCEILGDEHSFGEGCYTDPQAKFVTSWAAIIEPAIGRRVNFVNMHGATDGRHFYKYDSKVLVTSAETGNHHGQNEWVNIESLDTLAQALYTYLQIQE